MDLYAVVLADSGAFTSPTLLAEDVAARLDLVRPDQRRAEGIFQGQSLDCDVGTSCYHSFDEALAHVVPQTYAPAQDTLGAGEEYSLALGAGSEVAVVTTQGTTRAALTGRVGYGFCSDKSDPCPFYLGSFEASADSPIRVAAKCDDGKATQFRLDNLVLHLGQPAFGIADAKSELKGFPAAGLLVETSFSVGSEHHVVRRPNRLPVTLEAREGTFAADGLETTIEVPCGTSWTSITVRLKLAGHRKSRVGSERCQHRPGRGAETKEYRAYFEFRERRAGRWGRRYGLARLFRWPARGLRRWSATSSSARAIDRDPNDGPLR